jgi:hypothetical protein
VCVVYILYLSGSSSFYADNPTTFRRALPFPQVPAAGPVYFVEDEEIDFDRVLREEKTLFPRDSESVGQHIG